jgi:hypothetical protein
MNHRIVKPFHLLALFATQSSKHVLVNISFSSHLCLSTFFILYFLKGVVANLIKHLRSKTGHEIFKRYDDLFKKRDGNKSISFEICQKKLDLIRFFIRSNVAMKSLKNRFLRALLPFHMTYNTFCNSLIPCVVKKIHDKLDAELRGAHFVHLITDCWSSYLSISFLALGAVVVKEDFTRVTRIIGMVRVTGSQNAEALKEAIERIVNSYDFNKNK